MIATAYTDPFATKGIEYLLVIGFLLALIVYWRLLAAREPAVANAVAPARARTISGWFEVPDGPFYHRGHGWAAIGPQRTVRIGIDDFAQKLLGRASALELPPPGTDLAQGATGWRVRIGDRSVDMLSPVTGRIVDVNREVLRSPDLVNSDPYGRGWLLKVRVPALRANLSNLLSGALARSTMAETVRELRHRMTGGELGLVMQDGGLPVEGFARQLSANEWDRVAAEFLLTGPAPWGEPDVGTTDSET